LIPYSAIRLIRGQKMTLYRSSHNRREWLHVLDHCRAIERILFEGKVGDTYNIGSDVEMDVEAIADLLLGIFGLDSTNKTYVEDRPGYDRRYLLDSSKIRSELGWSPSVDFEQGFQETIAWYSSNPQWWQPLLDRLAIREDAW
jgi:dTDP-glucose 4,6-dehydratase